MKIQPLKLVLAPLACDCLIDKHPLLPRPKGMQLRRPQPIVLPCSKPIKLGRGAVGWPRPKQSRVARILESATIPCFAPLGHSEVRLPKYGRNPPREKPCRP